MIPDTSKQIVFLTGATSGIGKLAACALAQRGATVVATARDEKKGRELINFFEKKFPGKTGEIEILNCDLSSFESIVNAVESFKKRYLKLDLLINNAGIYNSHFKTSANGIEETFHVNVLAPLLLTHLLCDMVIRAKGRIINTSSSFHHGKINFNDIEGRKMYSGFNAYRQSKLAELLLNKIINQKLDGTGVHIYSQHPGVVKTNLGKASNKIFNMGLNLIGTSPEKGTETMIYLATTPKEKLVSGKYYAYKKMWKTKPDSNNIKLADELFRVCRHFLGIYIKESSLIFD
jgi:NAD(P)-dependent dehydrogenase (short-subunit alcohol dehydrogenase family)